MKFTELDLSHKVDAILKKYEPLMDAAIKADGASGLTLEQSKVSGACQNEIRAEIIKQGKVYVVEEDKAIKKVEQLHKMSKDAWHKASELVKGLAKKWDPAAADKVRGFARINKKAAEDLDEVTIGMRLHLDFRSRYGSQADVEKLLGERVFKELNTVYLALREPPMKKYMALSDKRTKIEEHAKRAAEFVSLLAGLEKKAKKVGNNEKKDVLVEVKKDAAAVAVTKDAFESLKAEVEKTVSLKENLEDKKIDQKKFDAYSTVLGRYESKLKEVKSKFKTCKILHDNIKVKCEGFEKESEFKKIIKELDTDYKMMDGVLTAFTKGVTKAAASAKKAKASLKK